MLGTVHTLMSLIFLLKTKGESTGKSSGHLVPNWWSGVFFLEREKEKEEKGKKRRGKGGVYMYDRRLPLTFLNCMTKFIRLLVVALVDDDDVEV